MQGAFKKLLFFISLILFCFFVTCSYQEQPESVLKNVKFNPLHYSYNVQIVSNKGSCSATVITDKLAFTATHCLNKKTEPHIIFKVFNRNRTFITYAEEYISFEEYDLALIIGNFKKVRKASYDTKNFDLFKRSHNFVACGYALGLELVCSPFVPLENEFFIYKGRGFIRPGMSGGGVFDLTTGKLVGVNSAAGEGYVVISPIFGVSLKYNFSFPE